MSATIASCVKKSLSASIASGVEKSLSTIIVTGAEQSLSAFNASGVEKKMLRQPCNWFCEKVYWRDTTCKLFCEKRSSAATLVIIGRRNQILH